MPFHSPESDDYVGEIIEDILRIEGWNQNAMATEIGVTQSAIARWISGACVPRESNR